MGIIDNQKCNSPLLLKSLHEIKLVRMYVLKRKGVHCTFFCIKAYRDTLNNTDVVDGTLLVKVSQSDMPCGRLDINGCNGSRDLLNQSKALFLILVYGSVNHFLKGRTSQSPGIPSSH